MMVREIHGRFLQWALRALLSLVLLSLLASVSLAAPGLPLQGKDETVADADDAAETTDEKEVEAGAAGDPVEPAEQDAEQGQPEEVSAKTGFIKFFSNWHWLEWLHDTTEGRSRGAARWFDGFFGSTEMEQQADISFGRLSTGLGYDERRGIDPEFRFRARLVLPRLDNRFNLMLGRMNADEFISDSQQGFEALPDSFNAGEDDDWLLGFGYNPISKKRSNLHFSVGAKFTWPPEPYVKGRYYYKFITGSRSQIKTQETVWWKSEEGVGAMTQINFEYMPGQRHMIRWANGFEVSELAQDLIWQSRLTLYQNLSDTRAMAYQIGVRGETGQQDPIEYYGFRLVYRQNFHREWLFWEARSGVYWPRGETLDTPAFYDKQSHEAVPFIFLGIEMFFGKGPKISRGID